MRSSSPLVSMATMRLRPGGWRGCRTTGRSSGMIAARSRSTAESTTTPALRMFSDGKDDGPVLLFVHGWPDDHQMWDKQVAHLKNRYRCVTTDLPGFGADSDEYDADVEKNGYSIDEIVCRLERTIEKAGNGEPVTLIAHDWGCTFSFMVEKKRPELVKRMVAIDVGGAVEPGLGSLIIMSYHLWLIAAFRIGGPIGDVMARSFARLVGAPAGARVATARSCNPYYHYWKRKLDKSQEPMGNLMPRAPLLFAYGSAGYKRVMPFHADWWAKKVNDKEGSSSVAMARSKHWVTTDQPDDLNRELDAFLEKK
ncbi:unnamed protein product [Ectocarpus sp. 4 AP-2014]